MNNAHAQLSQNVFPRRYSTANGERTLRSGRQDKPLPTTAPRSLTAASPDKKMTRGASNGHKNISVTKTSQNHSIKRQKVKLYIWVEPTEKKELERLAEIDGLSLSQTGRAIIVDGMRERLRLEREVLATPILEAMIDRKF